MQHAARAQQSPTPGCPFRSKQFLTRSRSSFLAEWVEPRGSNPAHYDEPANHRVTCSGGAVSRRFPRSLRAWVPRSSPAPGSGPIPRQGRASPRTAPRKPRGPGGAEASDSCPGLTLHRLRIPDFCPPAPDQIDRFVQIVDEANARGEAVGVHCALGFGRTGTMLACYLVKERGLAAGDAIAEIRRLRPGSIETYEQEKAVFQFYQRTK
uniref:Dual specificity phosphatase 23 n=1 Tax=Macaca fascicularis TaxID=9541 RepID=A0A7N9CQH0_MACFA